jgi:hypothetical protein
MNNNETWNPPSVTFSLESIQQALRQLPSPLGRTIRIRVPKFALTYSDTDLGFYTLPSTKLAKP